MKKQILVFLCGLVTPLIALIVSGIFGILPQSKSTLLVSKWHIISEPNQNTVLVNLRDDHNEPLTVGVERLNGPNEYRIGIVIKRKKEHSVAFVYRTKWRYGKPAATYGDYDHNGPVWQDLNADGIFDQCIDYNRKAMEINIEGKWVEGKKIDENNVRTSNGIYVFDANIGAWHINSSELTKEPFIER